MVYSCISIGFTCDYWRSFPFVTYVAWVFGILGIAFGALGMKKAKATGNGHGLSVAGLVLGIIGTVVGLTGFICIVICAAIAAV